MDDKLFSSDNPNESEEDRKLRELFYDIFPHKVEIYNDAFFVVPREGIYCFGVHYLKMKPGDVVRLNENGVPYIV